MKFFSYFIIALTSVMLLGCTKNSGSFQVGNKEVCFEETCFDVEIADDAEERREGLMYREKLGDDKGMLFVFEEPKPRISFWMKNTLIPLDILRLDTNGQVVHLEENVPPCTAEPCPTYGPKLAETVAKYVLELNAGTTEELGVEVGTQLSVGGVK